MLASQQAYSLREKNNILGAILSHEEEKITKLDKKAEMYAHFSFSSKIILMCRLLGSLKSGAGADTTRVLVSVN